MSFEARLEAAIAAEQARSRPSPGRAANAHRPTLVYNFPLPEDPDAPIAQPTGAQRRALDARQREIDEAAREAASREAARRRHAAQARRPIHRSTTAREPAEGFALNQAPDDPDGAIDAATRRAIALSEGRHTDARAREGVAAARRAADAVLRMQTPPPRSPSRGAVTAPSDTPPPPPPPQASATLDTPLAERRTRPHSVRSPASPGNPRQIEPPAAATAAAAASTPSAGGWEINDFTYENLLTLGTMAVSTGLSKEQLARYKSRPFEGTEPADCPVCLEDVVAGQPSLTLACKHAFHDNCIRAWLARTNRCPTCRFEVVRR
jgi:hypothetical protein